jgi:hypothetical protein
LLDRLAAPARNGFTGPAKLNDLATTWTLRSRADAVNWKKADESIFAAMAALKARRVYAALYYSFA